MDYIFRDLAISYLKRADLGQVKPEDLLSTGTKNDTALLPERGKTQAKEKAAPQLPKTADTKEAAKIMEARVKGYEGDPCPACGSFTLVRSGTCMKCDTCGSTTGCS